ncbi:MAG: ABC transporter substrate-binding protein [Gammaproteobacteria bacterium]|nr:ABC transporter substrate-binding protein [Gammaproteobacteria bacterium]
MLPAALPLQAQAAEYGPGASDTAIRIGNTNPYSGPASAYGTIGKAIAAYFDKLNAEGGINGRKLEFITLDDGYSPPKTKEQFRKLVEREQVLLVFQSLGTPTNSAVHTYMNRKKVPQLFVATGAAKWGDPENYPWTMGWQPNYQTEGRIYARYILDEHPNGRIGILFQNDDYGKDYVKGLRDGLGDKADSMIVAEESYEVTDPTVHSQIIKLKAAGADIFYNVTTPKFAAQAIRKVAELGWQPVHILNNVSTSVGSVLEPAGLDNSTGIITTAYLKDPTDPQWRDDPAFKAWNAWMDSYYADGDRSSTFNVYGYAAAQTLEVVLRQCGDDLTRENVMKQAASLDNVSVAMLLPGITIKTGPEDYYPIEQMQLQRFNGKSWELFGEVISGALGE